MTLLYPWYNDTDVNTEFFKEKNLERGVVDEEGGNSERCLKWGMGVIEESLQKHFKIEGR